MGDQVLLDVGPAKGQPQRWSPAKVKRKKLRATILALQAFDGVGKQGPVDVHYRMRHILALISDEVRLSGPGELIFEYLDPSQNNPVSGGGNVHVGDSVQEPVVVAVL